MIKNIGKLFIILVILFSVINIFSTNVIADEWPDSEDTGIWKGNFKGSYTLGELKAEKRILNEATQLSGGDIEAMTDAELQDWLDKLAPLHAITTKELKSLRLRLGKPGRFYQLDELIIGDELNLAKLRFVNEQQRRVVNEGYDNIENWQVNVNQTLPNSVKTIIGKIVKLLRNISILITVVVITILGIKYMIGSVEQKAEYKKGFITIIIGVALVTLVTSIVDFIFSAGQF